MQALPLIDPMPPIAPGRWPWLGSAPGLLRHPTAYLERARSRLGDTFVADVFGYRLFFVFSADGVRRLYALPEHEASFGLATFTLVFRHKIPLEIAAGRRNRPHDLFGNQEVEGYLENLERAVDHELAALGELGLVRGVRVGAPARTPARARQLGRRRGRDAASPRPAGPAFDRLDTSDSFVRPWRAVFAQRHGQAHRAPRRARDRGRDRRDPRRARAHRKAAGRLPRSDLGVVVRRARRRARRAGGARRDDHPHGRAVEPLRRARVDAREPAAAARRCSRASRPATTRCSSACANESIRMAQNSLTLRQVLQPIEVHDGHPRLSARAGRVPRDDALAQQHERGAGPRPFDPDHYDGRRLSGGVPLAARELVSTFGHGRHSCPAQRFSISAIRIALRRLVSRYELAPRFTSAERRPRQLGAVARAARPCPVSYRSKR